MKADDSRDLAAFLASRFAGTLGFEIQSAAVAWQVFTRTGSTLDLAWVAVAQFVPLAVISLVAGNVADRYDRRGILLLSRALFGIGSLALAGISVFPELGLTTLYTVLVLLGAVRAFSGPASWTLLPSLVSVDRLPRAIAMSSTTFQLATIIGPSTAGLVIAAGGTSAAYCAAAACEMAAVFALLLIRRELPRHPPPSESGLALLFSGVRYVWREKILLGALSLDLFAVLLGGAVALMPVYATDVLAVGEVGFGILRSAPAAGAAMVAILLALRPITRRAGMWMFVSVAVFGVATIVFGLSTSFPLSVAALVVLGGSDMVSVVIRQSIVQLSTPDAMRGRVSSVNSIFVNASNLLGDVESGVTAKLFGPLPLGAIRAVVVGGIGTLLVTGLWSALFPQLRRAEAVNRSS